MSGLAPSDGLFPADDDHGLARSLASMAGAALVDLKERRSRSSNVWALRDEADLLAHQLIAGHLSRHRPDDIVFSEEGAEDLRRLTAERTWIIDPLDGTHDFPHPGSAEWAVHIALVDRSAPLAASVAVPGIDTVFTTDTVQLAERAKRDRPIVVSGRANAYFAAEVAAALDADLVACGSAGVKAMLVVDGTVDVYVHSAGLWEWDVCAPAAVAAAAGAEVTDMRGNPISYNKRQPSVEGLVVTRPEFSQAVREALDLAL